MQMITYNDAKSQQIVSYSNIYACYRACRRRKRRTVNALLFEQNLEGNIVQLARELRSGTYLPKPALAFILHKPKQREIFAADFYDRVVHHVLVAELEPVWEKRFIHDSYACRAGKGNLAAVKRLQQFTRQATRNNTHPAYYLQLDITSYFTSINRNILYARLRRATNQPLLVELMYKIIYQDITRDCRIKGSSRADFMVLPARKTLFKAPPHKGLPIGNLTSQFFGNVYLDALDQYVKHTLKVRWYVRYCDDFVLLASTKEQLQTWHSAIEVFLVNTLELKLRNDYRLAPIRSGIDFLGYIIRPSHLTIRRRVAHSLDSLLFTTEKALYKKGYRYDNINGWQLPYDNELLAKLVASLNAYHGHLKHAASYKVWQKIHQRYSWLRHYAVQQDNGVFILCYPPWSPSSSFTRQLSMARYRFPSYVILMQLGRWWQIIEPSSLQQNKPKRRMVQASRVDGYVVRLQKHGYAVACIAQTGMRITTIYDRQLSMMYLPASSSPDRDSRHKTAQLPEQLALF